MDELFQEGDAIEGVISIGVGLFSCGNEEQILVEVAKVSQC